ncbi:MAG: YqaJ viral recombinase family protein [Candidatus Bathyarchaeota archaeon]|nr:YqaJ viral recombinase family protein [Candidatus Bathyarchaeota archaeon]
MSEQDKSRLAWLERRRKGIGASDAPKILGLSNFGSALSIYMDKLGLTEDFGMTERMEIGLDIEDTIIKIFKKKTGLRVSRLSKEVWSNEHPFLFATPDGKVIGQKSGLECKNIGIYDRSKWEGRIPDQYMIQCQHSMLVTGYDHWYLAALFGGNRFEYYDIPRDQELIDMIIPKLESFWFDNVLTQTPPEAQSIDASLLIDQFPNALDEDNPVEFDTETERILEDYNNAKEMVDKYEKKKKECSNILKQRLGTNKFGWTSNHCVTWSRWDSQKVDVNLLKEKHPEIYKQCLKTFKTGRLSISDR